MTMKSRAGLAADVVQHADVRVLQAGDRLRLALEALFQVGDSRRVRREDLDGDGPIEAGVASFVDLAHAAGAGELEDFVGPETRTGLECHGGVAAGL